MVIYKFKIRCLVFCILIIGVSGCKTLQKNTVGNLSSNKKTDNSPIFERFLEDDGDFYFGKVLPDNDGYFICTTLVKEREGKSDGLLYRLNKEGDVSWKKWVENSYSCDDINKTNDGNIATVGVNNKVESLLFRKYDKDGNKILEKIYKSKARLSANRMIVTSDQGFLVVGGGDNEVWKFSKEGDIEWTISFEKRFNLSALNSVIELDDGQFLIAGNAIYKQLDFSHVPNYFAAKIDKKGEIQWQKNYRSAEHVGDIKSLIKTSNEKVLFLGSKGFSPTGNPDDGISRYGAYGFMNIQTGELSDIHNLKDIDLSQISSGILVNEGYVFITSKRNVSESDSERYSDDDLVIVKITKNLEIVGQIKFGVEEYGDLDLDLVPDNNGFTVLATSNRDTGNWKLWFLKFSNSIFN